MKVSGFSLVRNGIKFGYPIVEAVSSVLPLCDEFILNVGESEDETLALVKSIESPKVRIVERSWDLTLRKGGQLLSVETNRALEECSGEWCFYIQADEVLHEKFHPAVREAMTRYLHDHKVEGLQFGYVHFYGSYDFVQDNYRNWYVKECRIIRRQQNIVSWGDGMDFRHRDGSSLRVKRIAAEIYHYGWVRPPDVMHTKSIHLNQLYCDDEEMEHRVPTVERTYNDLGNLRRFNGTHPSVMRNRIATSGWKFESHIDRQPPDWWRHVKIFLHPITKRVRKWLGVLL